MRTFCGVERTEDYSVAQTRNDNGLKSLNQALVGADQINLRLKTVQQD